MASLEGVKVGDELLLLTQYGGQREKDQVPEVVTVVKVGRTLVHIPLTEKDPEGKTLAYRIEDGRRNDNYGHTSVTTREAYEDGKRREGLWDRLRAHGFTGTMRVNPVPTATLEAVLALLDDMAAKESA